MPNWLYTYFGEVVKPLITIKEKRHLSMPILFNDNGTFSPPSFWIYPPEASHSSFTASLRSNPFLPSANFSLAAAFLSWRSTLPSMQDSCSRKKWCSPTTAHRRLSRLLLSHFVGILLPQRLQIAFCWMGDCYLGLSSTASPSRFSCNSFTPKRHFTQCHDSTSCRQSTQNGTMRCPITPSRDAYTPI